MKESIDAMARGDVVIIVGEHDDAERAVLAVAAHKVADTPVAFAEWGDMGTMRMASDEAALRSEMYDISGPWATRGLHSQTCRSGGVLLFRGAAEAAVDLSRLAGLAPTAILCDLAGEHVGPEGSAAAFAARHSLPIVTIDDVATYRWRTESLAERMAEAALPTAVADFTAIGYRDKITRGEHIALVLGDVEGRRDVLTRVHSACLTGDVFASLRCDCGDQLRISMEMIAEAGEGIVAYNPTHEGRGTGLVDKLAAYRLQEQGLDTAEANLRIGHAVDSRHYGIDAQIIRDLKVSSVRLLTNNPDKVRQLELFGIEVSERIPLWTARNPHNQFYLDTKVERLGHLPART